jgi:membrane-associated phospholipid phosphatase
MTLSTLNKENRVFFLGFFLFVIASLCLLIFYSKAEGFYLLNPFHSKFLDVEFIFFTCLGDGFFCVAFGLLLLVLKKRFLGLMVLSSYAVSGIIAQILKYYILEARPAVFLHDTSYKYFIENVTLHNMHAFPSGHTASAFALAAVCSFSIKNKKYSILFLSIAILVGYSRIYLAQHFLDDVFAGGLIGFLSAVFCWIFFEEIFKRLLYRYKI